MLGDLLAPRAPISFANFIDNYARRQQEAQAEEEARQERLAALFAALPA